MQLERLIATPTSLHEYVKAFWPVVEQANPFIDNWHIGAICEHLEACTFGEIRNLVINIPPGLAKSLLVAVMWPTWEWSFAPQIQWIFGSHSEGFALRDSNKCRRLIRSEEYQRAYGTLFQLRDDQDTKSKFENDRNGHRTAVGTTGKGTGERADRVVADDPTKAQDADSPVKLEEAKRWWFEAMSTRDRDPRTCVRVVIMQRLAVKDLTGEILKAELGYEYLKLPMRYDPKTVVPATALGFSDPRKQPGELLFPERVPESEVKRMEASLMSFGTAGQLQQEPIAREGAAVKRDWYKLVSKLDLPSIEAVTVGYDIAFSDAADADYTWGSYKARMKDGTTVTLWQHFGRWTSSARNQSMILTALKFKQFMDSLNIGWKIYLEAGVGGSVDVVKECRDALIAAGLPTTTTPAKGNKVARGVTYLAAAEAGRVGLYAGEQLKEFGFSDPVSAWVDPFLTEITKLRFNDDGTALVGGHDDMFDGESIAHNQLTKPQRAWQSYSPVIREA